MIRHTLATFSMVGTTLRRAWTLLFIFITTHMDSIPFIRLADNEKKHCASNSVKCATNHRPGLAGLKKKTGVYGARTRNLRRDRAAL